MTTSSGATTATQGTVAGRPQPQTTNEPAGGPFIRHAPDGRRAMYVNSSGAGGMQNSQFIANPMVSSPGWNKGYRLDFQWTNGVASVAPTATADAPWNWAQLVQMKDAFGTQLLTGPGYDILNLVPLYGAQFGLWDARSPHNSPVFAPANTTAGGYGNAHFTSYLPFEFGKGYGVISGANAALLPVLQINTAPYSSVFTGGTVTTYPTTQVTVDSDFYWLPNTPADPPGIGTTLQWIYQPCNPTIPTAASQLVQLPRLGGYLTTIILDMRDSTGARILDTAGGSYASGALNGAGWPTRPKLLVDGVPLVDTLMTTWLEDLAIKTSIGSDQSNTPTAAGGTPSGTIAVPRPGGTFGISFKTSLSQAELGLLDTGEIFLSTNPGTQLEIGGFPWGSVSNSPATLNALVGQVVPSGTLIQGLPEV